MQILSGEKVAEPESGTSRVFLCVPLSLTVKVHALHNVNAVLQFLRRQRVNIGSIIASRTTRCCGCSACMHVHHLCLHNIHSLEICLQMFYIPGKRTFRACISPSISCLDFTHTPCGPATLYHSKLNPDRNCRWRQENASWADLDADSALRYPHRPF